jgi:hypothetical protein
MDSHFTSKTLGQSSNDSTYINEDDMQEKITVNIVQTIDVKTKVLLPKNRVKVKNSNSMLSDTSDLEERPTNDNFKTRSNFMKAKPGAKLLKGMRKNNLTDQPPIKFGTFGITQRMCLVKADSVSIDLSEVKLERKGTIESKYEVLYTLGTGSYGEVQKIRDLESDELKVVKVISKEKCNTVDKYNEEIEILKKLVTYFTHIGSS